MRFWNMTFQFGLSSFSTIDFTDELPDFWNFTHTKRYRAFFFNPYCNANHIQTQKSPYYKRVRAPIKTIWLQITIKWKKSRCDLKD